MSPSLEGRTAPGCRGRAAYSCHRNLERAEELREKEFLEEWMLAKTGAREMAVGGVWEDSCSPPPGPTGKEWWVLYSLEGRRGLTMASSPSGP